MDMTIDQNKQLRTGGGTGKIIPKDLESNQVFDESFVTSNQDDYRAML